MSRNRAGDIMIPIDKYPSVRHTSTIREAVRVMKEAHLEVAQRRSLPRALLVLDEENHPLGIVRRRDILRGLEPRFLRTASVPERKRLFEIEIDPDLVDLSTGRLGKAIQEQAEHSVSEIMQPIVATLDYEDQLAKIVYKMLSRDLNLLLVIKDGQVVGVVRTVDVFREVTRQLL
jgi:predicted transcriptional regulator